MVSCHSGPFFLFTCVVCDLNRDLRRDRRHYANFNRHESRRPFSTHLPKGLSSTGPFPKNHNHINFSRLVTGPAGLGDDALELIDLLLGTAEGTEPSLGQLAGSLVLAVAEQFNDSALVGGKTGEKS